MGPTPTPLAAPVVPAVFGVGDLQVEGVLPRVVREVDGFRPARGPRKDAGSARDGADQTAVEVDGSPGPGIEAAPVDHDLVDSCTEDEDETADAGLVIRFRGIDARGDECRIEPSRAPSRSKLRGQRDDPKVAELMAIGIGVGEDRRDRSVKDGKDEIPFVTCGSGFGPPQGTAKQRWARSDSPPGTALQQD